MEEDAALECCSAGLRGDREETGVRDEEEIDVQVCTYKYYCERFPATD